MDIKKQIIKSNNIGEMVMDEIKIVGVDIPFIDLILLLIKLAIAAIPAAIVVSVFWTLIGGFLVGILNSTF